MSYLQKYFFPIPYSLFPIPYSLFPIPLFPVACCLLPVACSLKAGLWLQPYQLQDGCIFSYTTGSGRDDRAIAPYHI